MTDRSKRMGELACYIERHADQKLHLRELAARAGMSPAGFRRGFIAAVGVSSMEYRRAARINRLKSRLASRDDLAGAVYEAGFGSVSHVYESLDWSFGMTPAAYLQRGRGEDIRFAVRETRPGALIMAATSGACAMLTSGIRSRRSKPACTGSFPKPRSSARSQRAPRHWMPGFRRWAYISTKVDRGRICRCMCSVLRFRSASGDF